MHISEDILFALKDYCDKRAEYEVTSTVVGADGYSSSNQIERTKMEEAWNNVLRVNRSHDKEYNFGWKS